MPYQTMDSLKQAGQSGTPAEACWAIFWVMVVIFLGLYAMVGAAFLGNCLAGTLTENPIVQSRLAAVFWLAILLAAATVGCRFVRRRIGHNNGR